MSDWIDPWGADYDRWDLRERPEGVDDIGDESARALAGLTRLSSLDLTANDIGDDGARALATLTSLTSLRLQDNRIGDEGAKALAGLTSLTEIHIEGNLIGEVGTKALAHIPNLRRERRARRRRSAFGVPHRSTAALPPRTASIPPRASGSSCRGRTPRAMPVRRASRSAPSSRGR